MKQSCKTCNLWAYKEATDKAGRIQSEWLAQCLWKSKEDYPESVNWYFNPRPKAGLMQSDRGKECKCWEERKEI